MIVAKITVKEANQGDVLVARNCVFTPGGMANTMKVDQVQPHKEFQMLERYPRYDV